MAGLNDKMGRATRIGELDELRALAIAAVVLSHIGQVFYDDLPSARALAIPALGVGVDLFFVISGFVTVENARRLRLAAGGGFWRGAVGFWIRRVARVAVPAWAVVALLVALQTSDNRRSATLEDLRAAAGFYANFHWAPCFDGAGDCGESAVSAHFWSLASEMQFYAVAPFLAAMPRGYARGLAFVILAVGSVVDRPWGGYLWTFRADGFVVGALLAIELESPESWLRTLPRLGAWVAGLWIFAAAVVTRVFAIGGSGAGVVAIALLFGVLVGGSVAASADRSSAGVPFLRSVGALSFSIYLVHLPTMFWVRRVLHDVMPPTIVLIAAVGAMSIATLMLERTITAPAMIIGRRLSETFWQRRELKSIADGVKR